MTYHDWQPPNSNFTYLFTNNSISLINERLFLAFLRQRRPGGQTKVSASHSECIRSSQRQKGFWQMWWISTRLSERGLTSLFIIFCYCFGHSLRRAKAFKAMDKPKPRRRLLSCWRPRTTRLVDNVFVSLIEFDLYSGQSFQVLLQLINQL